MIFTGYQRFVVNLKNLFHIFAILPEFKSYFAIHWYLKIKEDSLQNKHQIKYIVNNDISKFPTNILCVETGVPMVIRIFICRWWEFGLFFKYCIETQYFRIILLILLCDNILWNNIIRFLGFLSAHRRTSNLLYCLAIISLFICLQNTSLSSHNDLNFTFVKESIIILTSILVQIFFMDYLINLHLFINISILVSQKTKFIYFGFNYVESIEQIDC